ncbi:MAG: methyltransferase domain-containing protein [Lewinellaceae bacterium]|nr:methyltransferase domain-containing protein [Lewinellaceae bacterium]
MPTTNYWNQNAPAWTALTRAGYDVYRDQLNTPNFLAILPDIAGLRGLDIGCGEGHNTRLLAGRGAQMAAIDVAEIFIQNAQQTEREQPLGIEYRVADAAALPFADAGFDFATSFMCMMDVPDVATAFSEAYRVLRPGGFFQFSITHPCFDTPHRRNLRDTDGRTYAIEVGDYFKNLKGELEEWIFGAAPPAEKARWPKFVIPRYTFTLSQWLNMLLDTGFMLDHFQEPRPSDATVAQFPSLQDAQVVSYFLHIRCRKN